MNSFSFTNSILRNFAKHLIKWRVMKYCKRDKSIDAKLIYDYLKENELTYYNYTWFNKFDCTKDYNIVQDKDGRWYVMYNGYKMYFKKSWSRNRIEEYLNNLLPEQDKRSPHLYFEEKENKDSYDVVVDAGVAEGLFALDVIDKCRKIYLIEPDEEWGEAIRKTFSSFGNKVVFIDKFLGLETNDSTCTLGSILNEVDNIDLVKLDIEGAELDALKGAGEGIDRVSEIIVCVYHYQNEEDDVLNFLNDLHNVNINYTVRKGYIFFVHDTNQKYPYLRHGVVRIKIQR